MPLPAPENLSAAECAADSAADRSPPSSLMCRLMKKSILLKRKGRASGSARRCVTSSAQMASHTLSSRSLNHSSKRSAAALPRCCRGCGAGRAGQ